MGANGTERYTIHGFPVSVAFIDKGKEIPAGRKVTHHFCEYFQYNWLLNNFSFIKIIFPWSGFVNLPHVLSSTLENIFSEWRYPLTSPFSLLFPFAFKLIVTYILYIYNFNSDVFYGCGVSRESACRLQCGSRVS